MTTKTPKNRPNVTHYDQNTQGRDFVVGDLHGCYDDLLRALTLLEFDGQVDRLFSVGDLVDRGPDSWKCANLIYETWFKCVKGNHEELMFESIITGSQGHLNCWFSNGGNWQYEIDRGEIGGVARSLQELPFVITVGEGENRFNIVHGELVMEDANGYPFPITDSIIDRWQFKEGDKNEMTWGRRLITSPRASLDLVPDKGWYHDMDKMSITFCGHTPVREVVQVQKQMYIDTGAVYYHTSKNKSEQHFLTLACPAEKQLYRYNMMWKTITKQSFDDVPKHG